MENSRFKFRVWDKKENILIERGSIDIHLGVFSTSNLLDSTRFIIEQCVVKWCDGEASFELSVETTDDYRIYECCCKNVFEDCEVVGNVHGLADNKIQAKELDDNKTSSKEV